MNPNNGDLNKSSLPSILKIKFWELMSRTPSYKPFCQELELNPDILTEKDCEKMGIKKSQLKKGVKLISRDVYNELLSEIDNMHLVELVSLPKSIQIWQRKKRHHKNLEIELVDLLDQWKHHRKALMEASQRLANELVEYIGTFPDRGYILADFIVGVASADSEIVELLLAEPSVIWLNSHLDAEYSWIKDSGEFSFIPSEKAIELYQILRKKASNGEFVGSCEVCCNWDVV